MSVNQKYLRDKEDNIFSPVTSIESIYDENGNPIKNSLLDMFYPVGTYYETSDENFDPNVIWGGTWVEDTEKKFLLGAERDSQELGYTVDYEGGEEQHTLITKELPSHTHSVSGNTDNKAAFNTGNQSASHTHALSSLKTSSSGNHHHAIGTTSTGTKGSNQVRVSSTSTSTSDYASGDAGAHTHTVSGNTGNQSVSHTHSVPAHNHSINLTSGATGSGTPFYLLPPYKCAFRWHRIA